MSAGGYLDGCGFIPASSGTGSFVVSAAVQGYQTPASAGAVNATVYTYRAESADKSQWEDGFGAYTVGTTTLARTTILASSNAGAATSFSAAPNVYITAAKADLQNAALLTSGTLPIARLNGGTSSQFARGDGTFQIFAAVKADQTTATSTAVAVVPAVQQNHPSACQAWVKFTGSGTNGAQTVTASYNVSGVSRTATGLYTVSFTVAFASANYVCLVTEIVGATNGWGQVQSLAAGSANIGFVTLGPASFDPGSGMVVCFGAQ